MIEFNFWKGWMSMLCYYWTIYVALTVPLFNSGDKSKCGYESCNAIKEDYVNVHIVPHTHDDVGWLKTVDQYYYGSRTSIQRAGVQYILDSVLEALEKDKSRRFIYVETAFLWKWWIQQHDIVKSRFRKLINNGQLEIIGGGWSMNDEAATHYHSIIDQFTWGLRKLNDSFGACGRPKIGWQIDPFGHSREMGSIFAQLGFDGVFLGRIDYQDKEFRFNTSNAEMVWRSSASLGNQSEIFTSVLYNTYSPPPGFCFDILCNDDPIIDSKKSPDYNVDRKVNDLINYIEKMAKVYRTNNVLITMGEDFNYQYANAWFKNLDKLIKYVNQKQTEGSKYNLLYSTPSCYLKAAYEESVKKNLKWQTKTDDFFPYASSQNSYWTGYFTSRPTIKRYERVGNNYLQVCKQLYALADLGPEDKADLNALREAMGVMQHHDAVTGTEKQHVADDYARILDNGFAECDIATTSALKKLSSGTDMLSPVNYQQCHFNISECPFTESEDSFVVTIYNPLSRPVNHYVRLPVAKKAYKVLDPDGKVIDVDVVPLSTSIINIPGRNSQATHDLIFLAADIHPLGFKSYYISVSEKDKAEEKYFKGVKSKITRTENGNVEVKTDATSFFYNESTGLLTAVNINNKYMPVSQQFFYYKGAVGNNDNEKNRSSGAYIFRPNGSDYKIAETVKAETYIGNLVAELRQTFSTWASQIIRIYRVENLVEFDWLIGPIPENDEVGKEVVTRYTTSLRTDSTFYTDSNGRELLKRVRNFRPTWKVNIAENVSGNYYPVTSKISIRDEKEDLELGILTDRAQGGTSLKDGEIELMVHRNCLHDDAFGVGEALREKAYDRGLVARGSHYLLSGSVLQSEGEESLAAQQKDIAQRKLLSAWTFLSPTNGLSFEAFKAKNKLQFEGLTRALPKNVQILTLEPWIGTSLLFRLEHIFEANEDQELSVPVVVDLNDLFTPFEIVSLEETTLGGNQWLKDNKRLHFTANEVNNEEEPILWKQNLLKSNSIYQNDEIDTKNTKDELKVTLTPMQIRTFVLTIKVK